MGCETEAGGAAVMWGVFRTAEVETELSHKEKLSIYLPVFVRSLTYSQELWVVIERLR